VSLGLLITDRTATGVNGTARNSSVRICLLAFSHAGQRGGCASFKTGPTSGIPKGVWLPGVVAQMSLASASASGSADFWLIRGKKSPKCPFSERLLKLPNDANYVKSHQFGCTS